MAKVGLVFGYLNIAIFMLSAGPAITKARMTAKTQQVAPSVSTAPVRNTIYVPERQLAFTQIVSSFARQYMSEPNAIRKTELRITKRKAAFMNFFGNDLSVHDWVGQLERLETLEDGSASVRLRIANDVAVQTQDSIFGKGTRLTPESPCYSILANASIGDWLAFSGVFVTGGEQDYIRIPGLASESTTMQSPTFEFTFTKMSPYKP